MSVCWLSSTSCGNEFSSWMQEMLLRDMGETPKGPRYLIIKDVDPKDHSRYSCLGPGALILKVFGPSVTVRIHPAAKYWQTPRELVFLFLRAMLHNPITSLERIWALDSMPHPAQRREACALNPVSLTAVACSGCFVSSSFALKLPRFASGFYSTSSDGCSCCSVQFSWVLRLWPLELRTGLLAEMAAWDSHVQSAAGNIQQGAIPSSAGPPADLCGCVVTPPAHPGKPLQKGGMQELSTGPRLHMG